LSTRNALAVWAFGLVAAQLLGLAVSDPARPPLAPRDLRAALRAHPSLGRVAQLRADASDDTRSFSVELPADWWPHGGRAAAPEAFSVFVDGKHVPVVGSGPPPSATGFAERRQRGQPSLWIHCAEQAECREAWVVRRGRWLALAGRASAGWSGAAPFLPYAFFGALAGATVWALAPVWPLRGLWTVGLLGTVTATWLVLLWRQPQAVWGLLGVQVLLTTLPPLVRVTRAALLAGATCLLWVGVLFAAYRPGILSPDSQAMYLDGVEGRIRHNVYPIVVSFLYGLAGRAFGSPAAILLAQLAGLAAGIALLTEPWKAPRRARRWLVLGAFLAAPPVWWVGVVLWSDVALAIALLWCVVALSRGRPRLGLGLLLGACALRHNAILAAAPLIAFAVAGIVPARRRALRALVLSLATAAGLFAPILVTRLSRVNDLWPISPALAWDILSISRAHPEVFERSVLRSELQPEQLHRLFSPAHANPLFNPSGPPGKRLDLVRLRDRKREILSDWWAAVTAHPRTYVDGRIGMFLALLDVPGSWPCDGFYSWPNPPPYAQPSTVLFPAFERIAVLANDSLLGRGWVWGVLLVAQAVAAFRRGPPGSLRLAVSLSGLCYLAGYLPVGQGCDFRFLYWPIVACLAAAAPLDQLERRSEA
jgi:hypothetical protein